ncbi:MAG: phage protein [Parabacteroides sp.]
MGFSTIVSDIYSVLKIFGVVGSKVTTYGFENITSSISHPSCGSITTKNTGVGSLGISMITERVSHEISCDGSVFIMKIDGNNGIVTMAIQQTSSLHKWLLQLSSYLMKKDSDPLLFGEINMSINDNNASTSFSCTGGSLLKVPDIIFTAQGQQINWIIYFADITPTTVSAITDNSSLGGLLGSTASSAISSLETIL